mmetsp:Transcript_36180/g.73864  ORF Transcript_36180/g.73864 Transcript_36180/m.73864 type:complete len:218 (+) Transcript_36180:3319-3972(+)
MDSVQEPPYGAQEGMSLPALKTVRSVLPQSKLRRRSSTCLPHKLFQMSSLGVPNTMLWSCSMVVCLVGTFSLTLIGVICLNGTLKQRPFWNWTIRRERRLVSWQGRCVSRPTFLPMNESNSKAFPRIPSYALCALWPRMPSCLLCHHLLANMLFGAVDQTVTFGTLVMGIALCVGEIGESTQDTRAQGVGQEEVGWCGEVFKIFLGHWEERKLKDPA